MPTMECQQRKLMPVV